MTYVLKTLLQFSSTFTTHGWNFCCCCCLIIKYQTSVNNILINMSNIGRVTPQLSSVSVGRGGRVPDTTNGGTELPRCEMSDWLFQTDLLIGRQWRQCCDGHDSFLSARSCHLSCQTYFHCFYTLFKLFGLVIGLLLPIQIERPLVEEFKIWAKNRKLSPYNYYMVTIFSHILNSSSFNRSPITISRTLNKV